MNQEREDEAREQQKLDDQRIEPIKESQPLTESDPYLKNLRYAFDRIFRPD